MKILAIDTSTLLRCISDGGRDFRRIYCNRCKDSFPKADAHGEKA